MKKRDEAKEFIQNILSANNGTPVLAEDIIRRALGSGIKKRTLDRAKKELNVVAEKKELQSEGYWTWRLLKEEITTLDDDRKIDSAMLAMIQGDARNYELRQEGNRVIKREVHPRDLKKLSKPKKHR